MARSTASRIADHLRPGMRLAIADGASAPVHLADDLTDAARRVGGISLVLGWCLEAPVDLAAGAFTDVRAFMGGFGLREAVNLGQVHYVPERLSAVPALLAGPLRPDVLVASMSRRGDHWHWPTEVAWMASVLDAGAVLLVDENDGLPATSVESGVPVGRGHVVNRSDRPPLALAPTAPRDVDRVIAERVAGLIPAGACLQYGPGPIADALAAVLAVPVHLRTGILSGAAIELERRGLLLSDPIATYVVGPPEVYEWVDGRRLTARLEVTHNLSQGAGTPFVALNSALEVDLTGQVNVQGTEAQHVSGIGGHPDFALIAHASPHGLSIVALPTSRGGRRTLVPRLAIAASTPRTDIDLVVTELGVADLRGQTDGERARRLQAIWPTVS